MSGQSRLGALITAVGADIKNLLALSTTQSGLTIVSSLLVTGVAPTVNGTYVTQGTLVVPAGSPAHLIELVGGGTCQIDTGTNPAETQFRYDLAIFDEAAALVGYASHTFSQGSTATTKTKYITLPIAGVAGANPGGAKTYTLQARVVGVIGTLGATAAFKVGGSYPFRQFRAVAQ